MSRSASDVHMFTPRLPLRFTRQPQRLATPMRCFISIPPARRSTPAFTMFRFDSLAIAWLLLVAAFSGFIDAARPRELRGKGVAADPYLVSPPGSSPIGNVRPAPKDLGEKKFVRTRRNREEIMAADCSLRAYDTSTNLERIDITINVIYTRMCQRIHNFFYPKMERTRRPSLTSFLLAP